MRIPFVPMPQQRLITDFMMRHNQCAIFGDMGVGKTAATLHTILQLVADGDIRAALVVAPLRVCTLTWPAEARRFAEFAPLRVYNLRTEDGKFAWCHGLGHVYLLNYEQLPSFCKDHWGINRHMPVDMIVWDECHRAKAHNSARIKAIKPFLGKIARHVGLTGTPTPNNYLELQPQISLLDGGKRLGSNFHAYKNRWFESDYMGWKWTLRAGAKEQIEKKIADITLTLRREDWVTLPPVEVRDVTRNLPPPLLKQYKELQKELLLEIRDQTVTAANAAVLVGKLQQFTSGQVYDENKEVVEIHDLKIQMLREVAEKSDGPLLVATKFIHERKRIVREIEGAEEFDESRMDDWNARKIRMWVADPRSVGVGLNLQLGSNHVVWYSLTHSFGDYDQFNCRVIRPGQTRPVTITRLVIPHTVDDAVAETLRTKGDGQSGLLTALVNIQKLSQLVICP